MPGILCEHCTAMCCRYIALPVDKPETKADFDDLRWFLLHERVSIFVEDGDWYVCFQTPCRHLLPDNRCGIYTTRPRICREYDTENCDYHSGDYQWELHFACVEHLDEYVRQRFAGGAGGGASVEVGERRGRGSGRRPSRPRVIDLPSDRRGVPLPLLPE